MGKTLRAMRLQEARQRIEKCTRQDRKVAYMHEFLSIRRLSRPNIRWARKRLEELRHEMDTNVATVNILNAIEARIDDAQDKLEARKIKHDKEWAAKNPAPPPVEAPPSGETTVQRLARLMAEQKENSNVPSGRN